MQLADAIGFGEFIHQLIEAPHQSADLCFAADALVMGK